MSAQVSILSDLMLYGAMTFSQDLDEFPANPRPGMWCLKNRQMYAYIDLGGLLTWYPFTNKTKVAIHNQDTPAMVWNINHGLGSVDAWYQAQDLNGVLQYVQRTNVTENSFQLTFASPIAGKVVIVAPDAVSAPAVETQMARIANDTVIIDSTGIKINGDSVLTSLEVNARIQAVVGAAPEALNTLFELGVALNDEANAIAAIIAQLATKADKDHTHMNLADIKAALKGLRWSDLA